MSGKKILKNRTKSKKDINASKKVRKSERQNSFFSKITSFFGCFDSYTEDSVILDKINSFADSSKGSKGIKGEKDDSVKRSASDVLPQESRNQVSSAPIEDEGALRAAKYHSTVRNRLIRPVKFKITASKDKSFSKKVFVSFADYLYSAKLSSYGALIFIFSVIAAIFTLGKSLIATGDIYAVNFKDAIFVLISALSSLTLFVSGKNSLCDSIHGSRICSYILFDCLGVSKSSVKTDGRHDPDHFVFILGGILLGVLTLFVSPVSLFCFLLKCLVFLIIFHSPESGCVLAFFVLPIFSMQSFASLILQTVFSYLCKVFICKRSFKPTFTDFIVFCFGLSFLFASVFYSGKVFTQGFIYLFAVSCFVMISLLIKNEWWIYRCVRTVRFSTVILSVGLIISSLRNILSELIPFEIARHISDIIPSNISIDESREMYILLGSFFVVSSVFSRRDAVVTLSDRIFTLIIAISVLLSGSPILMICFFAACIILSIRKNLRNIFYSIIIPSFLVAMMIAFIPDVFDKILSYCGFTSEFFVSRFANLTSSFKIALSSIIDIKGISAERITVLLEKDLPDSIGAIANGTGLYFGSITRTGILSLLTFLFIALILVSDYCVWGRSKKSNPKLRIAAFSGVLALVQLLFFGVFSYPFALIKDTAYIFMMLGLLYATTCILKDERNGEIEMPEQSYSLASPDKTE